jgi:hypothetical protein
MPKTPVPFSFQKMNFIYFIYVIIFVLLCPVSDNDFESLDGFAAAVPPGLVDLDLSGESSLSRALPSRDEQPADGRSSPLARALQCGRR